MTMKLSYLILMHQALCWFQQCLTCSDFMFWHCVQQSESDNSLLSSLSGKISSPVCISPLENFTRIIKPAWARHISTHKNGVITCYISGSTEQIIWTILVMAIWWILVVQDNTDNTQPPTITWMSHWWGFSSCSLLQKLTSVTALARVKLRSTMETLINSIRINYLASKQNNRGLDMLDTRWVSL